MHVMNSGRMAVLQYQLLQSTSESMPMACLIEPLAAPKSDAVKWPVRPSGDAFKALARHSSHLSHCWPKNSPSLPLSDRPVADYMQGILTATVTAVINLVAF